MTDCPKCGHAAIADASECVRCGVVFQKYQHRHDPIERPAVEALSPVAVHDPTLVVEQWVRTAGLLLLAWWTWGFATTAFGSPLLASVWHLPDLIFHEAGHVLFMPFGRFMMVLGGSLFQCALPLALAGVFLNQKNVFGAVVCIWWAGQNLVDVAPYIADARALQLVLIGGRTGAEVEGHDWEFILTELGWLHLDRTLGAGVYRAGLVTMIGALAAGMWTVLRPKRLRPGA
jgi:hypothetical protein